MAENSRWKGIARAAEDYHASTEIPCSFVALAGDGSRAVGSQLPEYSCEFCSTVEKHCSLAVSCPDTHRFAAYQAERFGGTYHYFCRFSLLHWAAPVILDGMLQGALICGPVLIMEPDELFFEECRVKNSLNAAGLQHFRRQLGSVKRIEPARANSLSNLLFMVALSLSDNDARTFFSDRHAFEQQSRIGEYLQHIKTMEGDKRSDFNYPIEKEKQLLKYATAGNKGEAEKLLDEILGFVLYSTGTHIDMVKSRILELAVLLSRAAVEGGADVEQIFGLNYHYLIRIRELETIEELTKWTLQIMERFIDLVFNLRNVQHTHKVLQAMRYVKHHYSERISLHGVSEAVQLSPSYLSRLFKAEMGVPFTEYLSGIRIEEARKLLLGSRMSLGDVAYACGFEDQSYFTKVFKKMVGIAPSRYREQDGRMLFSGRQ